MSKFLHVYLCFHLKKSVQVVIKPNFSALNKPIQNLLLIMMLHLLSVVANQIVLIITTCFMVYNPSSVTFSRDE